MKKFRAMLFALAVITFAALPSSAQNKPTAMSPEQIRASVERAQREGERLIVKLKNGTSTSGIVTGSYADRFTVMATHEPFGGGDSTTVLLSDVEAVKGRNPFVKGVKAVGITALTMAAFPVVFPTCMLSTLFHHPVLCPCTSGSMQ